MNPSTVIPPSPGTSAEHLLAVLERELADLPPLSAVAMRLMETLGNSEAAIADLAELIAMDQGIAAKVLRLVNSSYYGFPRQVTTISHAIVILGFNTVRNLVLAIAAFDKFDVGKDAPIDPEKFWEHSIGVAVCSQILARRKRLGSRIAEEAFLGGLLHDIGKLFLCQHFPSAYRSALEDAWRQRVRIAVSEQRLCGATHTLVGKRIAERWNLPPALVASIWRHHDPPTGSPHFDMVALVSVSDAITRASKMGFIGDPLAPTLSPEVTKWLSLDGAALKEVQTELREKVDDAREFLRMATGKG